MRLVFVVLALLGVAGIWLFYSNLLPQLPDQVPVHFNAAGVPDRYSDKAGLVLLPGVDTGLTAFFLALSFFAVFLGKKAPLLVNVPGKEQLALLNEDARGRALEPVGTVFAWLAFANHGLLGYLLWVTGEIALKRRDAMSPTPLAFVLVVVVGSVVFMTATTKMAIAREFEKARSQTGP